MGAASPLRVLVVEDDPDFRYLVVTSLLRSSEQYAVQAAEVASWFEDVCEACPDILLLDLTLHGVDALDYLPRVVACCPETMVASLTGRPAEEYEPAVLAAGAFVFYEKNSTADLPDYLSQDFALFQQALAGLDVVAPSALVRRPSSGWGSPLHASG